MNTKIIDFIGKQKIFFGVSISLMVIGIICNIIFGASLDIQFKGGAIVNYTSANQVDQAKIKDVVTKAMGVDVTVSVSQNLAQTTSTSDNYTTSINFAGNKAISPADQTKLTNAIKAAFPKDSFKYSSSNSVEPTMGTKFFLKCLVALVLACILLILYVGFRFRKIGGLSAGVTSIIALVHDVFIIYFTFIVFKMPIDQNFIAVALMILGYSLNDTVIVFDRVRENRSLQGKNMNLAQVFNLSVTQVIRRSIFTSLVTLIAITTVLIFALSYNLSSVVTFALPMVVGIITGCYSSIFIAGPLFVIWENHKTKKLEAAKSARLSKNKSKAKA
ncbi:MAG: protein translocase subunit SecF [Bacillota bacterium]|nr:protein translocase subunit SecF [Bacillota bacterium]